MLEHPLQLPEVNLIDIFLQVRVNHLPQLIDRHALGVGGLLQLTVALDPERNATLGEGADPLGLGAGGEDELAIAAKLLEQGTGQIALKRDPLLLLAAQALEDVRWVRSGKEATARNDNSGGKDSGERVGHERWD